MTNDELLTRHEVAKMLRVSLAQLYRWTRDGEITFVKLGTRSMRYRRSDIDDFIERHLRHRKPDETEDE